MKVSQSEIQDMRRLAQTDLFYLSRAILGYDQLSEGFHWDLCQFLQRPTRRKLIVLPRGFFKTTIATKAKAIQNSLCNPGVAQLICCQIIGNASKIVDDIRDQWERNTFLRTLFPELIPKGDRKWNSQEACLRRPDDVFSQQESTYEAGGIGTQLQSRHFDEIFADDLIVPRKDQVTGVWMQPTEEDIQKAIGWHQLTWGLLRDVQHSPYNQIMTRWCPSDLYNYLSKEEEGVWDIYVRSAIKDDGTAAFPEKYPLEILREIEASQGPYKFSTQYLCKPIDSEQLMFAGLYNTYEKPDLPKNWKRLVAACDPAIGKKRRSHPTAIGVVGMAEDGRRFILDAINERISPSETIAAIMRLWRKWHFRELALETTAYQEALKYGLLEEFQKMDGRPFRIREMRPGRGESKPARIEALQPSFQAGWWYVHIKMLDVMEQLDQYPMCAYDDILDMLAMAHRLLPIHKGLKEREPPPMIDPRAITYDDIMSRLPRARKKEPLYSLQTGGQVPHSERFI